MKRRKCISIGCVVAALLAAAVLYGGEYAYTGDPESLARGIEAFTPTQGGGGVVDLSAFADSPDQYIAVQEMTRDGARLTATFSNGDGTLAGTATFKRGINFRYRITGADYQDRGGIGKAELFLLEAGCLLIIGFGLILARYFWTKE